MKILRRMFSTFFITVILLFNAVSYAEMYVGEGSYAMSNVETLEIAKERAKVIAIHNVYEEACAYVKSYALTKNFNLNSDSAELITVNIIKLADEPNFNIENMIICATVKAQIDDSEINPWLYMNLRENIIQYKALCRAENKQTQLIAGLKKKLADNPQDSKLIAKEFAEADKVFISHQKLHDALKLYNKNDFNGTIRLCNEAIALNPSYNFSYNNRGLALIGLGQYEQAIKDFDKSIELHHACFNGYNHRGNIYRRLNQYEKALSDHNNAIKIKPESADSYFNRGVDYYCLSKYEEAIADFDKTLELDSSYESAEYYLELCYKALGK